MYKILSVDDEPEILNIIKLFLTKKGFEVTTVHGGEKALEILRSGIEFNLLIVDMKMPKVKGVEVLREMKDLNIDVPVIILSGSIDEIKHSTELKELGLIDSKYLIKPINLDELLEVVNELLE